MSEPRLQSARAQPQSGGSGSSGGILSEAQKDFAKLFANYMKDGAKAELFAFIDRQDFTELDRCMSLYFLIDILVTQRDRSRTVFTKLAERIAGHNLNAALLAGVLVSTPGKLWRAHYEELEGSQKSRIDRIVSKQRAKLPRAQRDFVEAFMKYMKDSKRLIVELAKLIASMKPGDSQASVRLYLELSEAYEDEAGKRSLDVFYFLSDRALRTGRSTYALEYEKGIADTASLLHARFDALGLDPRQGAERQLSLRASIKKAIEDDALKPGARPGESKLPPLNKDQADYVKLYHAYVDGGKGEQMVAFERALAKADGDMLAGFVAVYLDDSSRHYGDPPSSRSLEIFFGTLWWALDKSSSFYAVKVKSYIDAKDSLWSRRFNALNILQYGNRLRAKIEEKIANKRLLDDLKIAFWLKSNKDPTLAELRAFEPVTPPPDFKAIDDALSQIDVAVGANSLESLDKGYSSVAAAIEAQTDPKARWVLVKRMLEWTRQRSTVRGRLYCRLAYMQGVGLIYMASAKTYVGPYWSGFDEAEREFFFDIPERKADRYVADFAAQIDGTCRQRGGRAPKPRDPAYPNWDPGKNDDAYTLLAKAEAGLLMCAGRMGLPLTPPITAAALRGGVEEAWDRHRDNLEAIRIRIDGRKAGIADLKVGQTIGNVYILWWDKRSDTAYVQVQGYGQVVFEAGPRRLGRIYEDYQIWGKVAEYTEGIGLAIPFMFQILSYIPDLVSGGITGLVKGILIDLAFEHSMEALGIDPTKAQLVMLGVSLLHGGLQRRASEPHLGTMPEPALQKQGMAAPGGKPKRVELYDLDAGTVHVPEAPKPKFQLYGQDLKSQRSTDVLAGASTGPSSSKGYDPVAGPSLMMDERKTGPRCTATENPGTAPSIENASSTKKMPDTTAAPDSGGGFYTPEGMAGPVPYEQLDPFPLGAALTGKFEPRQRSIAYMTSGNQSFSGGTGGGPRSSAKAKGHSEPRLKDPERGTADWHAIESAKAADRREKIEQVANEQRVERARQGKSGENVLMESLVRSDTGPARMTILGKMSQFIASRRSGYQVYMYKNAEGQVVYVGLSGRTLEHGTGRTPLSDWQTRFLQDHVESLWIQNAKTLEVVSDLTYAQMNLLEDQLIRENLNKPWNFNQIPNPEARRILRQGIPDMVIPTNAKTYRFAVVVTGR